MRQIPKYPNYFITEAGEIFSCVGKQWRKLIARVGDRGYLTIGLCHKGNRKEFLVHRLVAKMYIPNPLNLPCVLHKDDDKLNPHRDNLKWGTQEDNVRDMYSKGRYNEGARATKVSALSPAGEVLEFNSIKEMCQALGFKYWSVVSALSRDCGRYKGWILTRKRTK